MKTDSNFAEILEEMSENQGVNSGTVNAAKSSSFNFSAGWESSLEPYGLSDLIGKTSIFKAQVRKYKSTFKRPTHLFNDEQKQAFEHLCAWAPKLQDNFSAIELRTNYRTALLKTHPDHGGTSEIFWATRKSYELLKSLVTSKV